MMRVRDHELATSCGILRQQRLSTRIGHLEYVGIVVEPGGALRRARPRPAIKVNRIFRRVDVEVDFRTVGYGRKERS